LKFYSVPYGVPQSGFLPGKQNIDNKVEEQAEFPKNTLQPLIEEAEKGKIKLYFVDAAHFVMQPYLGYLWCFIRCFILSSSGRSRYNVLGAFDFKSRKLISVCNDTYINSESICDLLRKLSKRNRGLPIKIVLDNARYQRCKKVQECALSLGIELVFLPSYSPQFNLIERFWKFLKGKCLYSKYYESFQLFKEAINRLVAS
jgi:transposase